MGQKMAYLEQATMGEVLGAHDWTPPTTIYACAGLVDFDPTLTAATIGEPDPGTTGYARIAITNDNTMWGDPATWGSNPASTSNLIEWDFPVATGDWPTGVTAVYLSDSATVGAGNMLYGTAVVGGTPVPVMTGSSLVIPVGAFVVRDY